MPKQSQNYIISSSKKYLFLLIFFTTAHTTFCSILLDQHQEEWKKAMTFLDNDKETSLWNLEQELRKKFPSMPKLLIIPGSTLGYFPKSYLDPAVYKYVNPYTRKKEVKDTSHTIIIPFPVDERIETKELLHAVLLHEIGHSQRPRQTDECIAASTFAAIAAGYASTLYGKKIEDINLLNLCLGLLWSYIAYQSTIIAHNNLEERRADSFMCQHADNSALQAMHAYHKKYTDDCVQYCSNHKILQHLPRSLSTNPDIAFHLYAITGLHTISNHPSPLSRMKKIEKELERRTLQAELLQRVQPSI